MLMHGLHWAWASPMQADPRIEKFPPRVCLIESEPHVSVRHAFIRQWSYQVPYPNVRFVLFRFHCLTFIFSISVKGSVVAVDALRNGSGRDFRRTCSIDHCLSLPWRNIFACSEGESAARNMKNEVLHEQIPFSVLFCFSASCPLVLRVQYLSQAQGQGMDRPQGALNSTFGPNGGLMSEFLCVFQGSAGA